MKTLATLIAFLAVAAPAGAVTVQRPDGSVAQPQQGWADGSLVPTRPGVVKLDVVDDAAAASACGVGYACYFPDSRSMVARVGDPRPRGNFLHELGHDFVMRYFTSWDWRAFDTILGVSGLGQYGRIPHTTNSASGVFATPNEWAAEAYSWCARLRRVSGSALPGAYFYWPTPIQHQRVCALFHRVAARAGL